MKNPFFKGFCPWLGWPNFRNFSFDGGMLLMSVCLHYRCGIEVGLPHHDENLVLTMIKVDLFQNSGYIRGESHNEIFFEKESIKELTNSFLPRSISWTNK